VHPGVDLFVVVRAGVVLQEAEETQRKELQIGWLEVVLKNITIQLLV
jgi:hypothetical protein